MPKYEITSPDGKKFEITAPDGATQDQVLAYAQSQWSAPKRDMAAEVANDPITRGALEAQKPQGFAENLGTVMFGDPEKTPVPGIARDIQRQVRLTGRYGLEALPSGGAIADTLGLPTPQNATERVVGDTARTMAQGAGIAGLAGKLAPTLAGVPQRIASQFAINTPTTIAANAAGGAGAGTAREGGAGPMGQMGASLGASLAVPLVANAGSVAANYARNNIGSSKSFAGRLANEVAGDRRREILDLLKGEQTGPLGERLTAGEAASPAGRAEFSGLEKVVRPNQATGFNDIAQSQAQARANAIRGFGGTPKDLKWAEEGRSIVTNPIREEALSNANIAGIKGAELAAKLQDRATQATSATGDVRRLSNAGQIADNYAQSGRMRLSNEMAPEVTGMPRISGKYSYGSELSKLADKAAASSADVSLQRGAEARFAQMQLDSIKQHGLEKIDPNKVIGHINTILSRPGDRASPLNEKVLSGVKDLVSSAIQKGGGNLDARDLYQIRKEGVNDVVSMLTKDLDASTKQRSGTLVNSIKDKIDDAIESAIGNTGQWSGPNGYLKTYANMSRDIDRMKVGQYLENKLTAPISEQGVDIPQRGSVYAQALRDAPQTLKRSTGFPRYEELGQVLTPEQLSITQNVGKSIGITDENARLGGLGAQKARELIGAIEPPLPSAGMLSPVYSVLRAIPNRIHGSVTSKVTETLSKAMQDPKAMAALMESATPAERAALAPYLPTAPILSGARAMTQGQSQ